MKQTMTTKLHQLDQALYECISGIDILEAVAPVNYKEERARFFQSNFSLNPRFAYNEHNVDLFKTKRALYQLPVESLQDSDLETLYGDIIESYVDKLDQFKSVGTTDFLYDSLRYAQPVAVPRHRGCNYWQRTWMTCRVAPNALEKLS
jgi:hypothetical protein